ncbi:hypothetical protein evm_013116 [Chilo suppressalis]|nr:hypothetical protein evm_013116 [Chilo suppressalis]
MIYVTGSNITIRAHTISYYLQFSQTSWCYVVVKSQAIYCGDKVTADYFQRCIPWLRRSVIREMKLSAQLLPRLKPY